LFIQEDTRLIKKRRLPRIYFGWWTVLTSGILNLWGYGYYAYGFSALFKPIATSLGFSRAVTSVAASIGRLEGGIEAPLTGWFTDKYGPRWIVFIGVFIIGFGLILMNFIDSLWAYLAIWGVMVGTGCNIALSIPMDTAITNWFVKKRGVALSIKWMFSGLSGVLVLPLIAWLMTIHGWRMTCFIGGVVMLFVGLPLVWFFVKQRRPEFYGLLPDGIKVEEGAKDADRLISRGIEYAAEVQEVEFTLRQSMRTLAYWIIIAAYIPLGLVQGAINIHLIPLLTDLGIDPVLAAGMMATMVAASIPSRLVGGFLADRVRIGHLRFLMGGALLLQAAGFLLFRLNQSIPMTYAFLVLYGIGLGADISLTPLVRARYFGRKAFGSIHGFSMMIMTPIGIAAPIYAGWVYDTTGSYLNAFTLFTVLLAIAAVLFPFAIPPKPPAEVTDIRRIV